MKRHAVPQNILDVEFKLFGALTVKQFINLAICSVIALIFYTLPLPDLVKWPLVIFFVVLGVALALFTVNGIPFTTWLSNFVLAMLTSQTRVWKKSASTPDMLKGSASNYGKYSTHLVSKSTKGEINMPLLDETTRKKVENVDKEEENRFDQISKHFEFNFKDNPNSTNTSVPQNTKEEIKKPPVIIDTKISGLGMDTNLNNPDIVAFKSGDNIVSTVKLEKNTPIGKPISFTKDEDIKIYDSFSQSQPLSQPVQIKREEVKEQPVENNKQEEIKDEPLPDIQVFSSNNSIPKPTTSKSNTNTQLKEQKINFLFDQLDYLQKQLKTIQGQNDQQQQLDIAQKIDQLSKDIISIRDSLKTPQSSQTQPEQQSENVKQEEKQEKKEEEFSLTGLTTQPVDKPNIVSGYVYDKQGRGIASVSVEIKDALGFPLRKALTDVNGYFTTATALNNGEYILDFEKQGRQFTDYRINLNGKVLPPYKFNEL